MTDAAGSSAGAVFVTGATGVVGRAVVSQLIEGGRPVVALARSQVAERALQSLGARCVRGDVMDRASLTAGMAGCQVAYHIAGVNASCLRDPSVLFEVNVGGSGNVMEAAAEAGVQRVVYTSSAATIGERQGDVGREDGEHRGWFLSDYERSKFEAEKAVVEQSRALGVEVVCVNPASVQGPGRAGGTARLLISFLTGRLRFFVPTRLSLVDVADCARGHVAAETKGRSGERYILSGATLEMEEALTLLSGITGVTRRPVSIPAAAASAVGAVAEGVGRARGRTPPLCREVVRTLLHGHAYDGSKAERELGLSYTPVEVTLRRTISWLVDQGLVSEAAAPGLAAQP